MSRSREGRHPGYVRQPRDQRAEIRTDPIAEVPGGVVARRQDEPAPVDTRVLVVLRRDVGNEEAARILRQLAVELGWQGLRGRFRRSG
jgi:hypothetical protein